MMNELMTVLVSRSYSHSEISYKIGILKDFFEYMFFVAHSTQVNASIIKLFSQNSDRSEADINFLEALPTSLFETFTQESFYEKLKELSKESKQLPTLSIVVPVILDAKNVALIGEWVRTEVGSNVLLNIDIDKEVSAGCQIIWHNTLHDFSLEHYITIHRENLENTIRDKMPSFTESNNI